MTDTTTGKRPRKAPDGQAMRLHSFRCDDPTWDAAVSRAFGNGVEMSTLFRDMLDAYAAGDDSFTFPADA